MLALLIWKRRPFVTCFWCSYVIFVYIDFLNIGERIFFISDLLYSLPYFLFSHKLLLCAHLAFLFRSLFLTQTHLPLWSLTPPTGSPCTSCLCCAVPMSALLAFFNSRILMMKSTKKKKNTFWIFFNLQFCFHNNGWAVSGDQKQRGTEWHCTNQLNLLSHCIYREDIIISL